MPFSSSSSVDGDPTKKKMTAGGGGGGGGGFRLFAKKRTKKHVPSAPIPGTASVSASPSSVTRTAASNSNYKGYGDANARMETAAAAAAVVAAPAATNTNINRNRNIGTPSSALAKTNPKSKNDNDNSNNSNQVDDDDPFKRMSIKPNWLSRTKFFQNMIDATFELIDQDGSQSIDEKELYSGLLLIHLKMGSYAGPAACKPISREKCHAVFMKMDVDGSGLLDKKEFEAVMMVLFGNVLLRVAIQYACTLLVVPIVAQLLMNGIMFLGHVLHRIVTILDEHFIMADTVEVIVEHLWSHAIHFWSKYYIPTVAVTKILSTLQKGLDVIPESVWNTIPLTLLSTVLSLMLIPWSLLQIDDFFQRVADKTKSKSNLHNINNNINNNSNKTTTKMTNKTTMKKLK